LVRNSTGGIDYLEEHRRGGIKGLRQVVGHVMDVESFCGDAWRGRMADLPDARTDMGRIGIPVTWICGQFDYWVNVHRVADMLTVRGPQGAAGRELITVPTGHIVRNSVEAGETFKIIAARLGKDLLDREIVAAAPTTRELLGLSKEERNRLRGPEFEPRAYCKRYLMGDGVNPLGFDVITLTAEYRNLLDRQIEALEVSPGDRVVDLGAGTGNMSEALLESLPPALSAGRAGELNLVDLVPEALHTARAKLERLQTGARAHRATVWCHTFDLSAVGGSTGGALPFGDASVDRVVASLLLSYLPDPVAVLKDADRALRPGGRILISSFLPDTDLSGPLKHLMGRISHASAAGETVGPWRGEDVLDAVRSYINDAAKLLDLACDGVFRFYDAGELSELLWAAGFRKVRTGTAFGDPGQAVMAWGERPAG
jgi:ubiquinone/menaquinone biosynthesis C-methylase UbiE